MTDPWTIIGWGVIAAIVVAIFVGVVIPVVLWSGSRARRYWDYWRTRNVPPEVGQCWQRPGGYTLYVNSIHENGVISVQTQRDPRYAIATASWGERPEEFRRRTRDGHWWLAQTGVDVRR